MPSRSFLLEAVTRVVFVCACRDRASEFSAFVCSDRMSPNLCSSRGGSFSMSLFQMRCGSFKRRGEEGSAGGSRPYARPYAKYY